MLDENSINERIKVLDSDIAKVAEQMQSLDKQKSDAIRDERTTRTNNNVSHFYKSLVMMSQILILTLVM